MSSVYATTQSFSLIANDNANFIWEWPPPLTSSPPFTLELGNAYDVRAHGFYHRDRVGYYLYMVGSMTNFVPDTFNWKTNDAV